jgi:hypothetical protein
MTEEIKKLDDTNDTDTIWNVHNDLIYIADEIGRGNYSVVCKIHWRSNNNYIENAIKKCEEIIPYKRAIEIKNIK